MSIWKTLFGQQPQYEAEHISSPLDLVTYVANLASNPDEIDPALDPVRTITSSLEPGQTPSAEDEQALLGVYLELEKYLTTEEPLRSFNCDELRSRLGPELRNRLSAYETLSREA